MPLFINPRPVAYTPALTFSATTPGDIAYAGRSGSSLIVYGVCFFEARIALSNKGTGPAGDVRISLPQICNSVYPPANIYVSNVTLTAGNTQVSALMIQGSAFMALYQIGSAVAGSVLQAAALANNSEIIVSGHYNI